MKLIHKIEKQLKKAGLVTVIDSFNDKSAKWISIYMSEKKKRKDKNVGNLIFNFKGTKLIDVEFHNYKESKAFYLSKIIEL
jgi:hypothetical protein